MMEEDIYLDDMEDVLEREEYSEDIVQAINNLAISFIARDQLKDKGDLIGHFEAGKTRWILGSLSFIIITIICMILVRVNIIFIIPAILSAIVAILWYVYYKEKSKIYIDIYEKAIIGNVEKPNLFKLIQISNGLFYFESATIKNRVLYLVVDDDENFRIRFLKNMDEIAYIINKQMGLIRKIK